MNIYQFKRELTPILYLQRLCDKIQYFRAMFEGSYKEAITSTATFPEDDRKTFGLLLKWVYTDIIYPVLWIEEEPGTGVWKENWNLFELYALADKLCIPEVMDRTFDAYVSSLKNKKVRPLPSIISKGYACTPENSPLRKFLCMEFVYTLLKFKDTPGGAYSNEKLHEVLLEVPDLVRDMIPHMRAVVGRTLVDPFSELPSCRYHTHPIGPEIFPVCPWSKNSQ